jgi:phosphoglycerate kinase
MRVITDVSDLSGKCVMVRVDYNVPMEGGKITDDERIVGTLPTIQYLLQRGASVILASHLGRPNGTRFQKKYSMEPVVLALERLLGRGVRLAPNDKRKARRLAAELKPEQILMLENLRFNAGEKANDPEFAEYLASLADIVVNDAFGAMHREHASIVGVEKLLPAYAGLLVAKEVSAFKQILELEDGRLTLVLGGSKVSDKIGMIEKLLDKAKTIIIGGAMCFTFLKACGHDVGKSKVELDYLEYAKQLITNANGRGIEVVLPLDVVLEDGSACDGARIPPDGIGLDIGEQSCWDFMDAIRRSTHVFWNGPMGMFERPPFDIGSRAVASAMAISHSAFTVVGGGDSAAAVKQFGMAQLMTHVSTGGGAALKLLERGTLPGLEVLE